MNVALSSSELSDADEVMQSTFFKILTAVISTHSATNLLVAIVKMVLQITFSEGSLKLVAIAIFMCQIIDNGIVYSIMEMYHVYVLV